MLDAITLWFADQDHKMMLGLALVAATVALATPKGTEWLAGIKAKLPDWLSKLNPFGGGGSTPSPISLESLAAYKAATPLEAQVVVNILIDYFISKEDSQGVMLASGVGQRLLDPEFRTGIKVAPSPQGK